MYILNTGQLSFNYDKKPYELWYGRPSLIKNFKVFGSKFYIKGDDDGLEKIESRTNERIFLIYSPTKKAYKFYNSKLNKNFESENVKVDYTK